MYPSRTYGASIAYSSTSDISGTYRSGLLGCGGVGGVGGGLVEGLDQDLVCVGWCYVCVRCESGFSV